MGGPVVEVAPRFGVVVGEGVVVLRCAGLGGGGEDIEGEGPLLVQFVEAVEGVAQDAEVVDPAALDRVRRKLGQLDLGGGQQVPGTVAKRLERFCRLGVALACAQAVGVVVVGPSVEVGVLLGVDVPGGEDFLAVAQIVVEAAQGMVVVSGDGRGPVGQWRTARGTGLGGTVAVAEWVCRRCAERALARIALIRRMYTSAVCSAVSGLRSCVTP